MVIGARQDSFAQSVRENATAIGLDPDAQRRHPRRAHRHLSLHRRAGRRHGARRERHGHLRAHHAGVPAPADGLHQPRRPRRDGDEPTRRVAAVADASTARLRFWPTPSPRSRRRSSGARARQAHRTQAEPHGGGAAEWREDRDGGPTRPTRRKSCSRRACSRSTSPSARRGSMPPTAAATRRSSPARTSTSRTPPAAVTPRRRRWPPALCAADRSRRRRGSPWGAGALACTSEKTIHPGMSWENINYILNKEEQ